jgi:hypothetical protein
MLKARFQPPQRVNDMKMMNKGKGKSKSTYGGKGKKGKK